MEIPQGLVEVILSEKLTMDEKLEAIPKFAWPILHLDGPLEGQYEAPPLSEEDAALICRVLEKGHYDVGSIDGQPVINFYFSKEDL